MVDLVQALKAQHLLENPSGSSICADSKPCRPALKDQVRIRRNKQEANRPREVLRITAPSHTPQHVLSPFQALGIYEGGQHKFCTACAGITDLVVDPSICLGLA